MIPVLIYTLFTFFLAYLNSELISKGKRIYHGLNGLSHVAVGVFLGCWQGWQFGLATLLFVRAVFDASLNLFRHLPLGYISPSPKSWVDKIEKQLIMFIVSRITRHVIVNNEIRKVAVLLKIFYVIVGVILCVI